MSDLSDFLLKNADPQRIKLLDAMQIASSKLKHLYTGFIDLDTKVGFTFDSRVVLVGDSGSGKTTLLYRLIGATQRTCRLCCTPILEWIDDATGDVTVRCKCGKNTPLRVLLYRTEESFDQVWAAMNGVLVDQLTSVALANNEDIFTMAANAFGKDLVDVLAIDSLTALLPESRRDGKDQAGMDARMMSKGWQILADALNARTMAEKPAMLLFTSQQRTDLSFQFAPSLVPYGGKSTKYYPTEIIRLNKPVPNANLKDPAKQFDTDKPSELHYVYLDFSFRIEKKKLGGGVNSRGGFRIFVDEFTTYIKSDKSKSGFTMLKKNYPGDTDEDERILDALKSIGDPLFIKKGGSYIVLGHAFKRLADIAAFLQRHDISYVCRILVAAHLMSATSRPYLVADDYIYGLKDKALINLISDAGLANTKQLTRKAETPAVGTDAAPAEEALNDNSDT